MEFKKTVYSVQDGIAVITMNYMKNLNAIDEQMADELQRKSDEYQKAVSTMPDAKKKETETELQTLYQKYQQAQQDDAAAMQKLQQEKLAPIQTKLQNAIKNVGDRGKYVYIMDIGAGIPYVSTTLSTDVTAEVKAELAKLK